MSGIKVSKQGIDVSSATPKELLISSQFDTIKICKTGSIDLYLPSETVNFTTKIHEEKIPHGLSYIPLFSPLTRGIVYDGDLETGGDWVLNDIAEQRIPGAGYSPSTITEIGGFFVDEDDLILQVQRINAFPVDVTFGARTCRVYYTLFYNDMENEEDLL